ncbi:hypothetical protein AMK59_8261 [Oryctes borbonicus]|uniref:Carbonic anhydrase n=1 Tax=Oryctes borbonicus TaxID=1629725 RepID=A0A0T6AWM7_9SCAR|nr:hypothetical protein AMK59_8261 [Oryctes borbonicus]
MLPLVYENFENEADLAVTNNGHTVQFKLNTNPMPTITGGPLLGKYKFMQFHFHWGAHDEEGSENQVNSHSFPMELHVVFYSTAYGTFENATQHPDGLCVVSFLYSKSEEDNENYNQIINLLPRVNEVGNSAKGIDPIVLELLLTEDKEHYYTYGGSLTTPPCTEDVTWIEFKSTIPLSHKQVGI